MLRPTAVEPVKLILSRPGCAAMCAPATWPSPGTTLTTPGGKPTSAMSSATRSERQRRELGRLEDDRVARRERRPHLPAREHQREVPRHDLPDDADRHAQDVVQEAALDRHDAPLDLVRHPAEVAERRTPCAGRPRRDASRIGCPVSRGLQRGELVGVRLDRVGEPQQQPTAIGGRGRAPRRERRARRVDRAIDVGGLRLGHVGELRAVVRIEDLERPAVGRIDERAPDEELVLHALSFLPLAGEREAVVVRSRPRPAAASRSTTARAAAGRRSPRRAASNASARSPDGGCRPAWTRRRPAP